MPKAYPKNRKQPIGRRRGDKYLVPLPLNVDGTDKSTEDKVKEVLEYTEKQVEKAELKESQLRRDRNNPDVARAIVIPQDLILLDKGWVGKHFSCGTVDSLYPTPDALYKRAMQYLDTHEGSTTAPNVPTITGLSLWLGFNDREEMLEYVKKNEYEVDSSNSNINQGVMENGSSGTIGKSGKGGSCNLSNDNGLRKNSWVTIIRKSIGMVNMCYEKLLCKTGSQIAGTIFYLKNMGWMDNVPPKSTTNNNSLSINLQIGDSAKSKILDAVCEIVNPPGVTQGSTTPVPPTQSDIDSILGEALDAT